MENKGSNRKNMIRSRKVLSKVKTSKEKRQKIQWVKVKAPAGSILITPKEIKGFKKHGINLLVALKQIQSEIYPMKKLSSVKVIKLN